MSDRFPVFPPLDSFVATLAKSILALPAGALDALAGTFGAPGAANKYVTDTDPRFDGYAQLAGRAGGQYLYGGIAANEDLTLEGTSHATKTTSYVLLQPNGGFVGIGTNSPSDLLHILSTTADAKFRIQTTAAGGFAFFELERQNNARGCLFQMSTDAVDNWWLGLLYNAGNPNDDFSISDTFSRADSALLIQASTKNVGIGTLSPSARLAINGGLHVGGDSDPGDNNLIVDGTKVNLAGIPTSAAGLAAGDLWVDTTGGLNIVKRV